MCCEVQDQNDWRLQSLAWINWRIKQKLQEQEYLTELKSSQSDNRGMEENRQGF